MLNKGAFALEIVRGDPELTADCRVTLNRGDRIGSLDCIMCLNQTITMFLSEEVTSLPKDKC